MIEVTGISKKLGSRQILDDISFKAENGQIYGHIGYNAVGKTTLMRIICGIYRPDKGSILSDGRPVYENPEVKRECFFMTEEAPFFDQSTMNKMRRFYKGYYPEWSDKTFDALVKWFGLNPDQQVSSFSKGMQRQASLTIAFSSRARVMLLDEAFDGLDEAIRKALSEMIRYYTGTKNAVTIISSHNLRELETLADRVGLIDNGHLTFNDSVETVHRDYGMGLEEFFCRERNIDEINWKEIFE